MKEYVNNEVVRMKMWGGVFCEGVSSFMIKISLNNQDLQMNIRCNIRPRDPRNRPQIITPMKGRNWGNDNSSFYKTKDKNG